MTQKLELIGVLYDPKTWNGGIHPQILKRRTAERRRKRVGERERRRERVELTELSFISNDLITKGIFAKAKYNSNKVDEIQVQIL